MAEPGASRPALLCLGLAIALLITGCGGSGSGDGADQPETTATAPAASGRIDAKNLTASLETVAPGLAGRSGSVLTSAVERSLGKGAAIAIKPASAECRPLGKTSSADEADQYPFACIIDGTAAAGGVSTEFTLGLVVFDTDGLCWKAANERIAVAAGRPILIPRKRALEPANVVSGCVAGSHA